MKTFKSLCAVLAAISCLASCNNTPKEYAVEVQQMDCISSEGLRIWGQLYMPKDAKGKLPLAILAHGFNGTYEEVDLYAEKLAEKGIAAYALEFCGGGNRSQSEGKTTDMTIFTEEGNILSIVERFKEEKWVDTQRMALLGCSQGGLVAATTTGRNPEIFKALVLVYPALTIPNTAPMQLARFDAAQSDSLNIMGLTLGRCYYEAINGYSVFELMPNFKGDSFIVYGDKDPIAAGDAIERAKECLGGSSEATVIADGAHGFPVPEHKQAACDAIVEFLSRVL